MFEFFYFPLGLVVVNIHGFLYLEKTSNRREIQFHAETLSSFVLNSHLDPTGEQNDVHHLSRYCVYLAHLVLHLPMVPHTLKTEKSKVVCFFIHRGKICHTGLESDCIDAAERNSSFATFTRF